MFTLEEIKEGAVYWQMVHLYQEAIRRKQALFLFSPKAFLKRTN